MSIFTGQQEPKQPKNGDTWINTGHESLDQQLANYYVQYNNNISNAKEAS